MNWLRQKKWTLKRALRLKEIDRHNLTELNKQPKVYDGLVWMKLKIIGIR